MFLHWGFHDQLVVQSTVQYIENLVEMVPQRKRNKKKGFDFSNAGGEVAVVDGKVVKGEVEEEEIV